MNLRNQALNHQDILIYINILISVGIYASLLIFFLSVSDSESGSGDVEMDPNLPYPGIAPVALRYLTQTTRPRSWCLALISNPYPFLYALFN